MKRLVIGVPSGIGDISWVYSKLHCAPTDYEFELCVSDGWPHRSVEFCELLPRVVKASYSDFKYQDIMVFAHMHKLSTFEDVAKCNFGVIYLSANAHLEAGKRLEEWLPDLHTDFYYDLKTTAGDIVSAGELIRHSDKIRIGISAASYRGSEAWSTWRLPKWMRFLDLVQESCAGAAEFYLLGGFWDDLTYGLSKRDDSVELVGKTNIAQVYEMQPLLQGYIGFSSGLGMIRMLRRLPTMMLWPEHQQLLSTSWAPQDMLEDGSYVASPWAEPFEVMTLADKWLSKHVLKEA